MGIAPPRQQRAWRSRLTAQEKFAEGIAAYTKAVAAFTELGKTEPAARAGVGLSRALAGSGDFTAALAAASRARGEAEKLANDDVLWRARDCRGRGAASSARAPEGPGRCEPRRRGCRPSHCRRRREALSAVARDSSGAFATLALLQAEDGDAAGAFETAERMRVNDLRVLLLRSERDIHRGMSAQEREEERTLAGEIVSLHAQLSRERGLPKPDAARIARIEKAVAEATEKKTAQQQALFAKLPALAHVAWTDGASDARRCRKTAARRRGHRRSTRRHRRLPPGIVRSSRR